MKSLKHIIDLNAKNQGCLQQKSARFESRLSGFELQWFIDLALPGLNNLPNTGFPAVFSENCTFFHQYYLYGTCTGDVRAMYGRSTEHPPTNPPDSS